MIPWWGFALYVSAGNAIRSNLNSHYKADGVRVRFWSSLVSAILLSPFLFLARWPDNIEFYISLALGCVLVSTLSIKLLDLSAKYGGPVATLSRPFHVFFSFTLWGLVAFDDTIVMMSDPKVLLGVMTAFALATGSQLSMYRHAVDLKHALKELLFVAACGAIMSVVIKYGMIFTEGYEQAVLWGCLTQIGVCVISIARSRLRHSVKAIADRHIMKAGLVMGIMNAAVVPAVILSLRATPNPAFTSIIFMLSTVWLMIYYKIRGLDARVRPMQIAFLLLSAIILIASTHKL